MSWMRELSKRGIDPSRVKDATEGYVFGIPEDRKFLKGCVIGDPTQCTASKALREEPDVTWAFVGAAVAILEFKNGDILRYYHNGMIAKMQDQLTMPPPGTYNLMPPVPSKRLGSVRPAKGKKGTNPNAGRRKSYTLSTAGQLRR